MSLRYAMCLICSQIWLLGGVMADGWRSPAMLFLGLCWLALSFVAYRDEPSISEGSPSKEKS